MKANIGRGLVDGAWYIILYQQASRRGRSDLVEIAVCCAACLSRLVGLSVRVRLAASLQLRGLANAVIASRVCVSSGERSRLSRAGVGAFLCAASSGHV